MDINTWRGIATIFVMIAFLGVCWWAFSPKRKKKFAEAANLPFADEQKESENPEQQDNQHQKRESQQDDSRS